MYLWNEDDVDVKDFESAKAFLSYLETKGPKYFCAVTTSLAKVSD